MDLTNAGRALGRSLLLFISESFRLCPAPRPFPQAHFCWPSFLLCSLDSIFFFLISALVWFIKITKVVPFESVEVFRKDPFLALHFSLSSWMISLLLCLLPSGALFTLIIWPFGPAPSRSLRRWRPHKELRFDWSAGLSTGVFLSISIFLSIRANVKPSSCQWIPTNLTSSPTSYSSPAFVVILLQPLLGSPSTALFPFLNMYLRWKPSFPLISRPCAVSLLPHGPF